MGNLICGLFVYGCGGSICAEGFQVWVGRRAQGEVAGGVRGALGVFRYFWILWFYMGDLQQRAAGTSDLQDSPDR